ncbi:hypothetical protein GQ457_11G027330 [Hibiscus cannabinus]
MGLYDCNGYWQTSTTEVLRVASDYFVSLFSANPPVEAPAFLEHITPSVTADMNSGLLASFTAEEVIAAFRDINPRKSPGIDGLPSGFFRQHWDILGEDFVSLCLDLLRGHTDMASVNETVIVLIPKFDKPTSMKQLRPISLCTVIYKTVSKVLVNRMKAILPHCISSAQAAFVQGRAITDNILVAHELVHTLHTSVSRSSQGAVFKLDMEKAFDRVEWPFLKAVMLRLGFAPSWVDLIMRCVSSVSSRVCVRGALSEAIRPQRGLRQGDPLSPFLFLFCSEGLSAALTAAQQEGHLPGVRASMSCYLLPCSLVEEMSRSIRRFWWSGKGSARGWPLVAWDDICLPKAAGGIGFKDLHLFNIALLGKQLWSLLSTPDSLLCCTLRAKYFPDGDLFSASAPARSSFAWKGLHRAMLRLRDGFFWTLGIDSQVRLFRDCWGASPLSPLRGTPLTGRRFLSAVATSWFPGKLVGIVPNFGPSAPRGRGLCT